MYETLVLGAARAFLSASQHFPYQSTDMTLHIRHFDFLLIFGFSYSVVSLGMDWRIRLRRLAMLVVSIFIIHAGALSLQTQVHLTRELWASDHIMLLLPREQQIVIWAKYMLFEFGLQVSPFVMMALWVDWNTRRGDFSSSFGAVARETGSALAGRSGEKGARHGRKFVLALSCVVALAVAALSVWLYIRERDPRHVQTHIWFGNRLLHEGRWPDAEVQYRAAIQGGSRDGRVWYNLAVLRRQQGDLPGSIDVIHRGLEVVEDAGWRDMMREMVGRWRSGI